MKKLFSLFLFSLLIFGISHAQCPPTNAPYIEDFGTGMLPNCWSQSALLGDGWLFTGSPGYDAANNGRAPATYAWIDFSSDDQGVIMQLIDVDISFLTAPKIEFDYFCYNTTNPNPANILYIEAFDGANWVLVNSIQTNSIQGWNTYNFLLAGYDVNGVVSLRLRGESGGATDDFYNDILVDNLFIGQANQSLLIGDSYQGGIIFSLDGNGGGLIAAPTDQSTMPNDIAQWGCWGTTISGADGTAIGTGNQNTIDIEAVCSTPGTAADICANLTLGGYNDWFLPSKDELNLMWLNLADSDGDGVNNGPSDPYNIGGFNSSYYWCSTEIDAYYAWIQHLGNSNLYIYDKHNNGSVRAVRAFDSNILQIDTLFYTGAIQTYVVPAGVTSITIETYGAQGGTAYSIFDGGKGALMQGDFNVYGGQVLKIVVGEKGENTSTYRSGGGGGSFVWTDGSSTPLIIAGGGGGGGGFPNGDENGTTNLNGQNGTQISGAYDGGPGAGGVNGYGGEAGGGGNNSGGSTQYQAGGGAGWYSYGGGSYPGLANPIFSGGGGNCSGGFGGGGGIDNSGGGGGGGYSGGGGSGWAGSSPNMNACGGGGGSYNSGTNQSNTSGINTGNGLVIISYQLPTLVNLVTNFSASDSSICLETTVNFTDLSSGTPTSWVWDFGDGNTSTLQNPAHIYDSSGTFNVSLSSIDSINGITDTITKTSFIEVLKVEIIQNDTTICQGDSLVLMVNVNTNSQSGNSNLSIGDSLQGGIIFYLDGNGGGLIAAPLDQSTGASWGCYGTTIFGADGTAIGTGNQNTIDIEAGCTTAGIAADICANLTLGGYNDWFLPSKDELNLMWTNLADSDGDGANNGPSDPNNLGGFFGYNYWSSTETGIINSWGQNFSNGNQYAVNKTLNLSYVRAVRAFTSNSNSSNYIYSWSPTNETTSTITVSPNTSTNYVLGVTIDNITCNDSTSILVNLSVNSTIDSTVCDSLQWLGNWLSTSGTYLDSLQNLVGCDSVVILNLTINNLTGTDFQTACDSYTWMDGNIYTQSTNSPTYLTQNAAGCDSIVNLNLIINNSTNNTLNITSCGDFVYNGLIYTTSGQYQVASTSLTGCDSLVNLNLTIDKSIASFSESSTLFTTQPFVVQFTNNTPNLSNFNFTWDFGDGIIQQDNNASLFHQYLYNGVYDVSLIAEDLISGCGFDTLIKDNLIFCTGGPGLSINENLSLVSIYPNPTNENITISINNYNGYIQTEIYDLIGNRLQISNENLISFKDYAKGIYLIKVAYGDRLEEFKIIKY